MNDEIKELMTNIIYNEDVNGFICTDERYKEIKNYITNLQQKVEQYENPDDLTLFYMWLDEKAKDKMKELQQEIQKKDAYIKYLEEYNSKYYKGKKFYGDSREELQSRIDKAIKLIESYNLGKYDYTIPLGGIIELLDILNGDNND